MSEQASVEIEGLGSMLVTTISSYSVEERRANAEITGEELNRNLTNRADEGISDSSWTALAAGVVTMGWGDGRTLEANKVQNEIDYEFYSVILDNQLCDECSATAAESDSEHHEFGDPRFVAPNPNCLSTNRGINGCRCMNIYVMKGA